MKKPAEQTPITGDRLKQRLVGAVALLLVGAIAWFWLLSADSPVDPVAKESRIPPAPAIQPFSVPEPAAPAGIEPIGSEREARPVLRSDVVAGTPTPAPAAAAASRAPAAKPAPAAKTPVAEKPVAEKPAAAAVAAPAVAAKTPMENFELDERGLPVAWVVQVGSFGAAANAEKMENNLQAKGFKAYTEKVKSGTGVAYKVYVGPKLSRERADAQKRAIDQALQLNTMVVRFFPQQ